MYPDAAGQLAVETVEPDVYQQPQSQEPCFLVCEQRQIDTDGHYRVQRVKSDAGAAGIVDGNGQQVIQIDSHAEHQQQKCGQPDAAVPGQGDADRLHQSI